MIFVLHYILFNAGASACFILIALFLQTYSEASLSEIGTLLMILPFVSIFVKPLFCALADRQQAHRLYMVGALFLTAAGYGSLAIAPFFPDFIKHHGRLVWALDIVSVVIGYSAFGVVWSLGDALSVNAARKRGIAWGSYRVWGTISWGVFGFLIGLINETPILPKYVPALLMLIAALLIEIVLWSFWPKSAFDMNNNPDAMLDCDGATADELKQIDSSRNKQHQPTSDQNTFDYNETWTANKSLGGTMSGSLRMNPRLVSALASSMMEDIGSTIRSSLRGSQTGGSSRQRVALKEVLEQHGMEAKVSPRVAALAARSPLLSRISLAGDSLRRPSEDFSSVGASDSQSRSGTLGRAAFRHANRVLSRLNSLGPVTAGDFAPSPMTRNSRPHHDKSDNLSSIVMSSTPQVARLSQKENKQIMATMGANEFAANEMSANNNNNNNNNVIMKQAVTNQQSLLVGKLEQELKISPQLSSSASNDGGAKVKKMMDAESLCSIEQEVEKYVEDLQMILVKLIVKRDKSIIKFLIAFTVFGFLMAIHISYFFMHVEQICRQRGQDFSQVMGALVAAQSVSEILSFIVIVRYYMPRVGQMGSLLTCAVLFGIRYVYYGTHYPEMSPYSAMLTETMHGLAYGMIYTLITDCASDCVEELDEYLPELIARGIVDPSISANQLKLPLRATMQGVFSGAFDGLGFGLGALFGGLLLDYASYVVLWQVSAAISGLTFVYIILVHR